MRRPLQPSRRQLALPLECEPPYQPPEEIRQEVVMTLADLLLEALGETPSSQTDEKRGANESED